MSKVKFIKILFDSEGLNKPLKCYQVGLLGCKEIKENHLGVKNGFDIYNYTVKFDDGSSLTIDNTFYVTDGSTDSSTIIINNPQYVGGESA